MIPIPRPNGLRIGCHKQKVTLLDGSECEGLAEWKGGMMFYKNRLFLLNAKEFENFRRICENEGDEEGFIYWGNPTALEEDIRTLIRYKVKEAEDE